MSEIGIYSVYGGEVYQCHRCGAIIIIRIVNGKAVKPSTHDSWKLIRGYWYCKTCKESVR